MGLYVSAFLVALFIWWLSTGVIIFAVRRGSARGLLPSVLTGSLAVAGFAAVYLSAPITTVAGAYLGFIGALAIWAFHEATFLMGLVTGPHTKSCPPGLSGFARFRAAFLVIRDHELSILASAILLTWLMWDAPNQTGLWVFMVLWGMRISAKINIFLGAPNAVSELMPERLRYLTSYFRVDRISPFFAVSMIAAALVFMFLGHAAFSAAEPYQMVGFMLLATFMALAIAEHFFLVLPVHDAALWAWAVPKGGMESLKATTDDPTAKIVPFPSSAESRGDRTLMQDDHSKSKSEENRNRTDARALGDVASKRGGMSWT